MTARSKLYLKGSDDEFWILGAADGIEDKVVRARIHGPAFIRFDQVPYLPGEVATPVYLDPREVAAVLPLDDREYEHALEDLPDWLQA